MAEPAAIPSLTEAARTSQPAGCEAQQSRISALFRTLKYPKLPILAKKTKQTGYIDHCQAVRLDDEGTVTKELTGPGSAWMELDAALHRAIGVGAAAVTVRHGARRR
ncbi:hypothetical protein ABZ802_35890 [Streptomyces sp. NPDC047737]|jgi:hypothetical protein|uniref:hypothetical protein n=1 Tax=unclassified Streptomyces TaxID=2593676 RepID=UPI0033C12D97